MKFTFKYDAAETGLSAIGFSNRSSAIKLKGNVCGRIHAPNWTSKDNLYSVGFMVETNEASCGWKWITLKYKDVSGLGMREWVQSNTDAIAAKYKLRFTED